MPASTRTNLRRGRASALGEAKELFVVWGALSQDGDVVNTDIVAKRLGVSTSAAEKLVDLVISSRGNDDDFLSLYYSEDNNFNTIGVVPGGSTTGRALRLTESEYVALACALDTLGVSQSDPLRQKIWTLYNKPLSEVDQLSNRIAQVASSVSYEVLSICSEALINQTSLRFTYQGTNDQEPHPRFVSPQTLSYRDGNWLLTAYDFERRGTRHFRIDRMTALEVPRANGPQSQVTQSSANHRARKVTLSFVDKKYLEFFDWPGLEIVKQDGATIIATIPYFNGSDRWLERRIAACRGAVTTNDEILNQRIDEYVRSLLGKDGGTISPENASMS